MRKPGISKFVLAGGLLWAGLLTVGAEARCTDKAGQTITPAQGSAAALLPQAEDAAPTATGTETPTGTATPTQTAVPTSTSTPTGEPTATPGSLSITAVEPAKISSLTGGSLSIYGTGFSENLAVRLVGFGLLDAVVQNSGAVRAVVPPGIKEGRYDLEIMMANGQAASLSNALRITSPSEPTNTPAPLMVFGRPQLLIQGARTEPPILRPGRPFTLNLEIVNRGDYTATNIRLSVASLDLAIPQGGSSLMVIDLIRAGESAATSLPLALAVDASAGFNNLDLSLEYGDYYGREYVSTQSIGLDVSDALADQPLVLVTAYDTQPETLSPGDRFTLRMEISNVGRSPAQQLLITLGGEGGGGLQPFAIIGSGNIQYVAELAAGETMILEEQFLLDGSADSGVYNMPVSLTYDTPEGARMTQNQVLNLLASRRPRIQIGFYRGVEPGLVNQPMELPIEVVNIGRNLVNISTVEVSGDGLEIIEGSAFIGALDGGTSGTFDATVVPTGSGSIPVEVRIHYLDDFNQPQVISETLFIEVEAPQIGQAEAPDESQEAPSFWDRLLRFLRGMFGLGS